MMKKNNEDLCQWKCMDLALTSLDNNNRVTNKFHAKLIICYPNNSDSEHENHRTNIMEDRIDVT